MPSPATTDYASAARRYQVSTRTARRWVKAGADLADPASVARHLASMASPSPKALDAIIEQLRTRTQS